MLLSMLPSMLPLHHPRPQTCTALLQACMSSLWPSTVTLRHA
jgi:hypothetical protein